MLPTYHLRGVQRKSMKLLRPKPCPSRGIATIIDLWPSVSQTLPVCLCMGLKLESGKQTWRRVWNVPHTTELGGGRAGILAQIPLDPKPALWSASVPWASGLQVGCVNQRSTSWVWGKVTWRGFVAHRGSTPRHRVMSQARPGAQSGLSACHLTKQDYLHLFHS